MAASGTRTVSIKFDGSAAGFIKAAGLVSKSLKAIEDRNKNATRSINNATAAVGRAAAGFLTAASAVSTLGSGVGVVLALASALVAVSGAAFLIAPALIGAVGAMAAIKLGADGIKKAFEPLTPTLDRLKAAVSKSFEQSLAPAVKNLKTLIPQVTVGLKSMATAMGGVATRVTNLMKSEGSGKLLNQTLITMSGAIKNIGAFLAPVIVAFIKIGAVVAPLLVKLTDGFGAAGERFKAFIDRAADSGALVEWVNQAIATFRALFQVIGTIGGIVKDVFSAAGAAGLGFGGVIGDVLKTIREFTSSLEGQTALRSFFEAVKEIGTAVSQVLGAALKAIAPIIPPLMLAFKTLATTLSQSLVPTIQFLAPILMGVATAIGFLSPVLAPIAVAIGAIAAVIWTVTTAVKLWQAAVLAYTIVQWALNAAMTANPIGLVIAAIAALIAIIVLIIMNLDFFRGIWDAVWKWCSDLITTVVEWISSKWDAFWAGLSSLLGQVQSTWSSVWNSIKSFFGTIIDWVVGKAEGFGRTIRGIWDGIGSFIGGVWDGIKSGFKSAINGVISFANGAIRGINAVSGAVGIPAIPQIPMLARGGTARGGRSYLVGEEGPELFTPGRTGRVTNAGTTAEALGSGLPPQIHVYIGDRELTDMIDVRMEDNTAAATRSIRSGSGAYR